MRADEQKAITALLERDDFESDKAMAKALYEAVTEMVEAREGYVVGVRLSADSPSGTYGPFFHKRKATSYAAKWAGVVGEGNVIVRTIKPGVWKDPSASYEDDFCPDCTHTWEVHLPSYRWGKSTSKRTNPFRKGCIVLDCTCKEVK